MPVYHSSFNDKKGGQTTCGTVLLPVKTKVKGPAPPAKPDERDIIDDAIEFFRANVLHRNFKVEGPADLTLCYLTVFISECLRIFAKRKTKAEGQKDVSSLSLSGNFAIPGDAGFCLTGYFTAPASRSEADLFRNYFRQLREETANRLIEKAYNADGSQSKWWIQFSKRKFMNIDHT